jgi:hypothetical protein
MGGKESFVESENKIMKKIAKAVLIDKSWIMNTYNINYKIKSILCISRLCI